MHMAQRAKQAQRRILFFPPNGARVRYRFEIGIFAPWAPATPSPSECGPSALLSPHRIRYVRRELGGRTGIVMRSTSGRNTAPVEACGSVSSVTSATGKPTRRQTRGKVEVKGKCAMCDVREEWKLVGKVNTGLACMHHKTTVKVESISTGVD